MPNIRAFRTLPEIREMKPRSRVTTALLIVATVILGISSRQFSPAFPAFFAKYGGDTLWAANVFFLLVFLFPAVPAVCAALVALGISVLVELSQIYHAPWIDALRETALGGLVLGYGFLWSDLVCYATGVALAFVADYWLMNHLRVVKKHTGG